MTDRHWFSLPLKNDRIDRRWNKKQWKEIDRYFRTVSRLIEQVEQKLKGEQSNG